MKTLLLFLFVLLTSAYPSPDKNFTIIGQIQGLKDSYIYLKWSDIDDNQHLDSVPVVNMVFKFTGKISDPTVATIFCRNGEAVGFFLGNENIKLAGRLGHLKFASFDGSDLQREYEAYYATVKGYLSQDATLFNQYMKARKNKDSLLESHIGEQRKELAVSMAEKNIGFIDKHPGSFVSLYLLRGMIFEKDIARVIKLFDRLDPKLLSSPAGKQIAGQLAVRKRTAIGNQAPLFTQTDLNGNPVNLSDFRGRWVLLDFWSSRCAPCRAKNPDLVRIYNDYSDRNFTVVGISLDKNKEEWQKAIVQDGLPWVQLSDLRGGKNEVYQQYCLGGIPHNFLIDPTGVIVAKDLWGHALRKNLEKLVEQND